LVFYADDTGNRESISALFEEVAAPPGFLANSGGRLLFFLSLLGPPTGKEPFLFA
jgi:hypothetical protein